jgi:branched-chain amino acid aminotransferase/4-amino-4-deoxychorismate lyase
MIWVDGKILPDDGLLINAADRTFEHGLGLFETLRTWGGRPTLLDRHRARMLRSASELKLPIDPSSLPDAGAVLSLLEAEGVEGDRMLRITATGGTASGRSVVWIRSGALPLAIREGGAVICVNSWAIDHGSIPRGLSPLPNPPPQGGRETDEGRELVSLGQASGASLWPPPPSWGRVGERGPSHHQEPSHHPSAAPDDFTARHKTLNYWFKRVAYEEARDRGYDETLIETNPRGFTEASRSNLFVINNNQLMTCSTDAPIVPGIMRQLVLDAAKELPLDIQEVRGLDPAHLNPATEVFLTNAVRGIIPVARIDTPGGSIERLAPGPWTQRLQGLIADRLWPDRGEHP